MSRPVFTAELINDLKARVIAHNRAVEAQGGGTLTKLADVKRAYERGHKGKSPGERAMAKVDDFLASLTLAKAGEFEENEHPRDDDGKFTHKGSAGAGRRSGGSQRTQRPEAAAQPEHQAAPIPLPKTRVAHEALQESNAGYRAITTDVLPTHQAEFEGAVIRDVGLLAGGTALAAALMRHRPPGASPGMLLRVARRVGGSVGGAVAGTIAAAATYGGTALVGKLKAVSAAGARVAGRAASSAMSGVDGTRVYAGAVKNLAERAARAQAAPPTYAFASRVSRAAMAGGNWAGQKAADVGLVHTGNLLRNIRTAYANNARTPVGRALRHAGFTLGTGATLGFAARSAIRNTPIDPQVIGMGMDAFSHREIRKGDQLDEAYGALRKVAHDGASFDDLRKAMRLPGQIGRGGLGALTALGALAGGAVGAGLGYGESRLTKPAGDGKKGNPYHAEDGRFTSRDRAHTIVGGVAGAVAAGALALMAARRGNAKIIPQVARRMDDFLARRLNSIKSQTGRGPVAEAVANKSAHVEDMISGKSVRVNGADVPAPKPVQDFIAAKKLNEVHGPASPLLYQARVRRVLTQEMARRAAASDEFLVGNTKMAEIRARAGLRTGDTKALAEAQKLFAKMTDPKEFEQAIAQMPADEKNAMRALWQGRAGAATMVETKIAEHAAALDAKKLDLESAKEAVAQARTAFDDAAKALSDMAEGARGRRAAETARDTAQKALRAAQNAETAAQKSFSELSAQGPDVAHPITGQRIPADTAAEVQQTLRDLEGKARAAAEKSLNDVIGGVRDQQIASAQGVHARWMGALAASAARYGTPKGARPARNALMRAQQSFREARKALDMAREGKAPSAAVEQIREFFAAEAARHGATVKEAEAALEAARKLTGKQAASAVSKAQRALNSAKLARDGVAREAGKTVADAANAVQNGQKLPKSVIASLEARVAQANQQRAEAVANFQAALNNAAAPKPFLPQGVREALEDAKRDYGIIRGEVGKRLDAFLQRPSMVNLSKYAAVAKQKAGKYKTAAIHTAFYRFDRDGNPVFSPAKAARALRWLKVSALVSAAGGGGAGAVAVSNWLDEHKKALRDLRFEQNVDPNTGAGYIGLSIKDQSDPKERVFVWGVRQDNPDAPEKPIFAGGRVSAIRNQQSGKGGPAPEQQKARDLDKEVAKVVSTALTKVGTESHQGDFDGAPKVTFRRADDPDPGGVNDAAGKFMQEVRKRASGDNNAQLKGAPGGKQLYAALDLLFSQEGAVLKASQISGLITGYKPNGEFSQGLLPQNAELKKDTPRDDFVSALKSEIGTIMVGPNAPKDDFQRANLHRAATVIGIARGVSAADMAGVHEIIRAGSSSTGAAASNTRTSEAKADFGAAPMEAEQSKATLYEAAQERDLPTPSAWDKQDFYRLSESHVTRLKGPLGLGGQTDDDEMLAGTLRTLARSVHQADPAANMNVSLSIAADALRATAVKSTGSDRTNMTNAIRELDWMEFSPELENQIALWRQRMRKRAPVGRPLEKISFRGMWDAAKHPRAPAGSDAGGEFTAGSKVARHMEAGADQNEHRLRHARNSQAGASSDMPDERKPRAAAQDRSLFDPHRMGYELGGMIGGAAGWSGAGKLVDKFKARAADKAVEAAINAAAEKPGLAMRLARGFVGSGPGGMALKLAGSVIASSGAQRIAQAGVDAAYRVAGKKPPPHYEAPPAQDYGQLAAEFLAGTAGWTAGAAVGAVGGPVGAAVGGATASYAAAEGGKRLYQWFSGYDQGSVDKITRRYLGSHA